MDVPLPTDMPFYDPTLNSTWQVFLSTYFFEHITRTLFDAAPYEFYFNWDMLPNPLYWLTTSSLEAFMPYLTSTYGDSIPCDINIKVTRVWNFRSSRADNRLSFKLNLEGEVLLHMPDGSR